MIRPVRLRLSRAKGFDLQAHSHAINGLPTVNCARPGPYGNPFIVGRHGTRAVCVRLFMALWDGFLPITVDRETIDAARKLIPEMRAKASALRGHNLGCWCHLPSEGAVDVCHCTVWLAIANDADPVATLRPLAQGTTLIDFNEESELLALSTISIQGAPLP